MKGRRGSRCCGPCGKVEKQGPTGFLIDFTKMGLEGKDKTKKAKGGPWGKEPGRFGENFSKERAALGGDGSERLESRGRWEEKRKQGSIGGMSRVSY